MNIIKVEIIVLNEDGTTTVRELKAKQILLEEKQGVEFDYGRESETWGRPVGCHPNGKYAFRITGLTNVESYNDNMRTSK